MARTTLYPAPRVFPTYRLNRVAKTCTMTSDVGNADVRGVRGSAMDKFLWEDNTCGAKERTRSRRGMQTERTVLVHGDVSTMSGIRGCVP